VANLALKMLMHDKLRFGITISGVAFAATLVLVQTGLFFGLLENASITIEKSAADLWVTSKNTPNVDFAHKFPETHVNRVRSVPGVARADNLIVSFMEMALPSGAQEGVMIYALEDFAAWSLPWDVSEGDLQDLRRGKFFVLDEGAKKRYGAFDVAEHREIMGQRLEISGKSRGARSFTTTPIAFMDLKVAQSLNPGYLDGRATYVLVKLEPGADVEAVRREIKTRLPYNDVYTKAEWAARSRSYWIKNTGLGLNIFFTVFLGCLVGTIVVAQTLYTSTMEHLREFGTVKAIGGSNRDIYAILGKQATLAAIGGFLVGLVPTFGLDPVIRAADLKLVIPPELVAAVFVGTILLCLGAALLSFRKVASIDPALVFRG
jgi:putative ABC transport system permease protein